MRAGGRKEGQADGQVVGQSVRVSSCICRHTEFADLLPRARAHGWSLEELMQQTGCGAQCGLCRPYLRRMLRT
ncbi:MAG: bacterioferritin-associated ferredoxin, partial [Gemmatimonadales bacterium]